MLTILLLYKNVRSNILPASLSGLVGLFRYFTSDVNKGRPSNISKSEAFEDLCKWLDTNSECEVRTVTELYEKMCEVSSGCEYYALKVFKEKLLERYEL